MLAKGLAQPTEILLLAFTAKAADEMRQRIAEKLGVSVPVRTFHALGLEIIAAASGKKPVSGVPGGGGHGCGKAAQSRS